MSTCISPLTLHRGAHVVPCGKCNFCLSNKRQDWSFRLEQELHDASSARFITLTYDADTVPIVQTDQGEKFTLRKEDLGRFHEEIKQFQNRYINKHAKKNKWARQKTNGFKAKWRIRYFSVGEYGSNTQRPHYHSIMFNAMPETLEALSSGQIWGRGFVKFGNVNTKTINYVAKYVVDRPAQLITGMIRPFCFMSKNPGLGHGYLGRAKKWHKPMAGQREDYRFYRKNGQYRIRLPRYYKDRMFTTTERQVAAIEASFQSNEQYDREISQLCLYGDPHQEYEHRLKAKHDRIRVKSLELNTF